MISDTSTAFGIADASSRGQLPGNSSRALQVQWERSAFANLLESDVGFASSDGCQPAAASAADEDTQAEPSFRSGTGMNAPPFENTGTGPSSTMDVALPARQPAINGSGRIAQAVAAAPPCAQTVSESGARGESRSVAASTSWLPRHSWSRTAMAACLRGSEVHLCLRAADVAANEQWLEQVRELVRTLGLSLASLRVNGVSSQS